MPRPNPILTYRRSVVLEPCLAHELPRSAQCPGSGPDAPIWRITCPGRGASRLEASVRQAATPSHVLVAMACACDSPPDIPPCPRSGKAHLPGESGRPRPENRRVPAAPALVRGRRKQRHRIRRQQMRIWRIWHRRLQALLCGPPQPEIGNGSRMGGVFRCPSGGTAVGIVRGSFRVGPARHRFAWQEGHGRYGRARKAPSVTPRLAASGRAPRGRQDPSASGRHPG